MRWAGSSGQRPNIYFYNARASLLASPICDSKWMLHVLCISRMGFMRLHAVGVNIYALLMRHALLIVYS